MTIIDYTKEPCSDIAFIDIKSFYASVECVQRGFHPLTTSLCVMSNADNSSGLILASSPTFKKVFGKGNVGRSRELPFDINTRKFSFENAKRQGIIITKKYVDFIEYWAKKTYIVPPRMAIYIQENLKIQKILENYAPRQDICPYSIDEGFVDLTSSLDYFVKDRALSKKHKLDIVSTKIQYDIYRQTGVYSTVGMSNANPLLAKLALDNEAKQNKNMRANWSYEDVEDKVWSIQNLTDFWGIGSRIAKRLKKLAIFNIRDLANANPDILKKEFGVMGVQLWFHANGVDESKVSIRYATVVAIHIGFSSSECKKSINASMKISPTKSIYELTNHVLFLFRQKYTGGSVRSIAVRYDKLVEQDYEVLTFFDDNEKKIKMEKLEDSIDEIREKFGYLSIQKATSLMDGSRVRQRSKLIGGHCGGMDGIT